VSRVRTKTGGLPYARYQLQRAILETALENNYTTDDRKAALEFFGGCAFCGAPQAPRNDHLVPVIQCGDFIRHNVVPACQKCDDSKGQKEYHEWMRSADSPSSLKRRGLTEKEVERRIQRIEKWQAGYKSKTEEQLFGKSYGRYREILQRMDALCAEAKQLVNNIRYESDPIIAPHLNQPQLSEHGKKKADKIRRFVLDKYIRQARARGDKSITIRSGDVHAQMRLHQQHANVCQALKGDKLQQMASIKLLSIKGPPAGGNTYFTYQL